MKQILDSWAPWLLNSNIIEGRKRNFEQAQQLIDKRAAYDGPPRGDFWDHVLIKSENDNEKGEGLTKAEMMVNASVLVVGGMEPVSTALGGATYLLLKHPEKMQKLLGEIRSAFKSAQDIGEFAGLVGQASKLTFRRRAFAESLAIPSCLL
jgi:versicolorin B desaturase